jgi:hypothetical protein
MSRPRFLADNDFSDHIVDGLYRIEPSIDILTVREVGMQAIPDPEILEYAAREARIILTHDLNTMVGFAYERIKMRKPMAGLIAIPQRIGPRIPIDQLLMVWLASEAEEMQNDVMYIPM